MGPGTPILFFRQQQQAFVFEPHIPRLRPGLQGGPGIAWQFGFKLRMVARLGRLAEPKIQGSLEGRIDGTSQPAGKSILAFGAVHEAHVVRANAYKRHADQRAGHSQAAVPTVHLNASRPHHAERCQVLAAGQAGHFHRTGPLEQLLLGSAGGHSSGGQGHQMVREAVGLVAVVGDENGDAAEAGQDLAHMLLKLVAQVGIQCGKRLVEKERFGLHGEGARQGHALPLASRQVRGVAAG
jgi:hypothetical protein